MNMISNNPLSYILIQPKVINQNGLNEIITHIQKSKVKDLSVFDPQKTNHTGQTHFNVKKSTRDTQIVEMGNLFPKIESLMHSTVKNIINPFYNIQIKESEIPQILSYSVGGHYKPHVDGESLWRSPDNELIWKKSIDRDLSIVFFLNNDFEGGDFVFPQLKIRIKPEPGMMICFPSNHHYLHGVEPVTKGKRYSIVCWATVQGFVSFEEQNKQLSLRYNIDVTN